MRKFAIPLLLLLFLGCGGGDDNDQPDYRLIAFGTLDGEAVDFSFRYRENYVASPWNSFAVISDSFVVDLDEAGEFVVRGVKTGYVVANDYDTIAVTEEAPVARIVFEFEPQTK